MIYSIVSIFPELFDSFLATSFIQRGIAKKLIQVDLYNPRDYSTDKHKKVDDSPYGGGAGMVMACQPLVDCIEDIKKKTESQKIRTIYLSPKGKVLNHRGSQKLSHYDHLILVCGRYEGIDQRVIDLVIDEEISIGKYVLSGGEIPAMVIMEATARFIPDFVGKGDSVAHDSFSEALEGKKEYPHYTRPEEFRGLKVPEILLSGHHEEIEKWRKSQLK